MRVFSIEKIQTPQAEACATNPSAKQVTLQARDFGLEQQIQALQFRIVGKHSQAEAHGFGGGGRIA